MNAWDAIKEILFDDDAKAFADFVKEAGVPAPNEDHIGYEVEGDDGEVIATVEIACPINMLAYDCRIRLMIKKNLKIWDGRS